MLYNRFACPLPFIHHCNMTRVNIWPWLLSSLLLSSSSPLDNPTRIDQSTTPFQLPMTFIVRLLSRWTKKYLRTLRGTMAACYTSSGNHRPEEVALPTQRTNLRAPRRIFVPRLRQNFVQKQLNRKITRIQLSLSFVIITE